MPQSGGFTGGNTATFTGNVVARCHETTTDNPLILAPFLGRSYDRGILSGNWGSGANAQSLTISFNRAF
ncbi:hypothetical protein OSH11_17275 [Kaistia dalseonensis]|uniref:Uncharacterized protein n=1 Tax=Kaistia dalseonensis TaxID=410840 RepID=A0ABU0H9V9_9HYPH|nr:hypothetical protein [Kaistia dalseonensis]MCX5496461.1 hypothetical protein [Kaistia dalseonensis]MDQ0439082.1 hypothetical protein [Kaistia dalseonensis]